jgi:hypothetical protein
MPRRILGSHRGAMKTCRIYTGHPAHAFQRRSDGIWQARSQNDSGCNRQDSAQHYQQREKQPIRWGCAVHCPAHTTPITRMANARKIAASLKSMSVSYRCVADLKAGATFTGLWAINPQRAGPAFSCRSPIALGSQERASPLTLFLTPAIKSALRSYPGCD